MECWPDRQVSPQRFRQDASDLADLSSVSGIAQARLDQITSRARTLAFIDDDCAGTYEELAVSYGDRAAILAYANSATQDELWDLVRTEPDTVAPLLISLGRTSPPGARPRPCRPGSPATR